jgi:hypothetical protein
METSVVRPSLNASTSVVFGIRTNWLVCSVTKFGTRNRKQRTEKSVPAPVPVALHPAVKGQGLRKQVQAGTIGSLPTKSICPAMNPQEVFCPDWDCSSRGLVDRGNIRVHSYAQRRYRCTTCAKTFAATRGTSPPAPTGVVDGPGDLRPHAPVARRRGESASRPPRPRV